MHTEDLVEQTKEVIEKYVLPCVKFVDPPILDKTGIIAQVLKENLEPYKDLDINGETWEMHWQTLAKLVNCQCTSFKSSRSQHLGKGLLGEF